MNMITRSRGVEDMTNEELVAILKVGSGERLDYVERVILSRMNDTSQSDKEKGDNLSPTLSKVMRDMLFDNRDLAYYMFGKEANYVRMYKDVKAAISLWLAYKSTSDPKYLRMYGIAREKLDKTPQALIKLDEYLYELDSLTKPVEAEIVN